MPRHESKLPGWALSRTIPAPALLICAKLLLIAAKYRLAAVNRAPRCNNHPLRAVCFWGRPSRFLLQQCAGALDLDAVPGPQLRVALRPDVVVEHLLDDRGRQDVGLPAALAILLDVALGAAFAGLDLD